MRMFITGGTGFVGSHVINAAHRAGYDVRALRRPGAIPRVSLSIEPEWVDGPLDGDHRKALTGTDVFVHLAAHTPNPPYDTLEACLYWNVTASIRLAEQAADVGVHRFIVAGTCFEYGRTADRVSQLSPTDALEPIASYPASKAAASVAFQALARERGLRLMIARLFQVYGEGEQSTRFWPSLQAAARDGRDFPMSDGTQIRDFINVSDVAERIVRATPLTTVSAGSPEIRHVATGHPETLLSFAQRWWTSWEASGKLLLGALPIRATETMRIVSADEAILR